jgi:glycosyltransferase involved in cell wall biosynthesis
MLHLGSEMRCLRRLDESKTMRILIAHNNYQLPGGEDGVVEAEISLLRSKGHEVAEYRRDNSEITGMSKPVLAANTLWSRHTAHELVRLIAEFRPDVVHAHNTFPLISPSLYWAAERAGVPVVQTLHNFRLLCVSAMFLRDGKVCEECMGRLPWRGVVNKCYRDSAVQSALLAGMLVLHRSLGTYRNKVSRYIALNDFCRNKFIEGGLPSERIVVKPNFADGTADNRELRQGALFVGRFSSEKGIGVLMSAVDQVPACQLSVIGSGPDEVTLCSRTNIQKLGFLTRDQIYHHMKGATFLLVPSICYETFGLVVIEAFACGLPVIASRIGALAELVRDGETGLLFEPGNPRDLADKIAWAMANPEHMREMGRKARAQYEAEFSAEVNYLLLMNIYDGVLAER